MTHLPPGLEPRTFTLRGTHIALDALLKATGLAASGGHAKLLIQAGEVQVDGGVQTRRSVKLRPGQQVLVAGHRLLIMAAPSGVAAADANA